MTKFLTHLKNRTKYVATDMKLSSTTIAKNKNLEVAANDSKMKQRLKRSAQLSVQQKEYEYQDVQAKKLNLGCCSHCVFIYPPIQKPFDLGMAICRSCFSPFLPHTITYTAH